jgi:glycosyltransferase involved in cell wall biosynthesis
VITVLTASVAERAGMLAENMASVAAQSHAPVAHLVGVDHWRRGGAATYNALLEAVETEWFCCLDDDDLADPDHLFTMAYRAKDHDVVYTYCRSEGRTFEQYNRPFSGDEVESNSIVPITALCRTRLALKVGGFPDTWDYDRAFWAALHRAGARFLAVPIVTWTYRYHGANQSHGQLRSPA